MTKRAAPGKRWSATSTTERFDANGAKLGDVGGAAVKVKVRYRLDGKSRQATFADPDADTQAVHYRHLLAAAYTGDWDADDRHNPAPAVALPLPSVGPEPEPLPLPTAGDDTIVDIDALVKWQAAKHRSSKKKKGGGTRSPKTTHGYDNNLAFFAERARYPAGDPRVVAGHVEAGASIRIDDPAFGVTEADLITFIDERSATNLRTRGANERRMRTWVRSVERELDRAERDGREPVIPDEPTLAPETVSARTIDSSCQEVRRLFHDAYRRGIIRYQPWTPSVDEEVVHAIPAVRKLKNLPNGDQVRLLADTMAGTERAGYTADGSLGQISGDRYAAMIELSGVLGLREEEVAGIRLSWVELDRDQPRIGLRGAEVYHPLDEGGRVRATVPLKARAEGTIRWVALHDRPDVIERLRNHIDRHVATPDPTSGDEYRKDPHLFTTETGAPVDFSNWNTAWWKPVVAAAFNDSDTEHLAGFRFGNLRHAAITRWLTEGRTLHWCATQAGNSQAVIEENYAGIMDEIGYRPDGANQTPLAAVPPNAVTLDGIENLGTDALTRLMATISQTLVSRQTA